MLLDITENTMRTLVQIKALLKWGSWGIRFHYSLENNFWGEAYVLYFLHVKNLNLEFGAKFTVLLKYYLL